jgi:Fe-S oxidoreductase
MNPGNIVASPAVTEHLRYGPEYKTWEPKTLLDFSAQGGFAAAVEMCNGVGVCRKKLEGTMCPSYMATRDEEHSTRGRANALRAVLSGKVPAADFAGKRLYEVMDLCLECKGCKAECPSNVDMAKMKYEFLYHYHQAIGLPLRNRIFGHIARLSKWGVRLAPLSNWIAASAPQPLAHGKVRGHRPPPPPACLRPRELHRLVRSAARARGGRPAAPSCSFTTRSSATTRRRSARAAGGAARGAGYKVELVDRKCCGRPLISKGMLDERASTRAGTSSVSSPGWPGGAHRGPRAVLPAHPARRVGRAPAHRRRA